MKFINPFSDDSGSYSQGSGGSGILGLMMQEANLRHTVDKFNYEQAQAEQQAAEIAQFGPQSLAYLKAQPDEGMPNEFGYVDPRETQAYQSMVNVLEGYMASGNPLLQKMAMSAFDNLVNKSLPNPGTLGGASDIVTNDIKNYKFAQQNGYGGTFEQWVIDSKRAGATQIGGQNVNNYPEAEKPYLQGRGKGDAEAMNQLTASAESAYRQKQSLDQFINASANGFEGGAADMLSGAANLFSSFGINIAPEKLNDTALMSQAANSILANRMNELGSRGLTDADMRILRDSLPQVNSTKEARVRIAQILQKAADYTILQYKQRAEQEDATYPGNSFYRPSWMKTWQPGVTQPLQQTGAGSSQDNPIAVNSPEEATQLPINSWFKTPDGRVIQKKR